MLTGMAARLVVPPNEVGENSGVSGQKMNLILGSLYRFTR